MRNILAWAAVLILPVGMSVYAAEKAAPAVKQKSPAKKAPTQSSTGIAQAKSANKTHAAAAKSRPKPTASKATAAKKGKKPVNRTTWRNRQTVPSPDRYKEIQNALAEKGYLAPEAANGEWSQASVDALTKFQTDQHIDSTGKLNSLSLIALGLGPKHDSRASMASPAPSATSASAAQPLN